VLALTWGRIREVSVLDLFKLFKKARIVDARLASAPIAIAGGRTALHLKIEGAGVIVIGDLRLRFWRGFDGTVLAPVVDQIGRPIAVRVTNLAGTVERAVPFVPLPALRVTTQAPVRVPTHAIVLPPAPRTRHISLRWLSISVHPRGTP
jgi:hypothetical protein